MLMIFILLIFNIASSSGKLFGDHICQTEIIEPQEMTQWELKNRTVRKYEWCMNVPPRCSVYYNIVVNETTTSVKNVSKVVEKCCEGFEEQNNNCVSLCQDCKNGLCMRGSCICQSGWEGTNCNTRILNYKESTIGSTSTEIIQDSSLPHTTTDKAKYEIFTHITSSTQHSSLETFDTSTRSPTTFESSADNHSSSKQLYSSFETSTYDTSSIRQITTNGNRSYYTTLAKNDPKNLTTQSPQEETSTSSVNTPTSTASSKMNTQISSISLSTLNDNSPYFTALKTTTPSVSTTQLPLEETTQSLSVNTSFTFGTSSSETFRGTVITPGVEDEKTPSLFDRNLLITTTTPNSTVNFEEDDAFSDSATSTSTSEYKSNGLEENVPNNYLTEKTSFANTAVTSRATLKATESTFENNEENTPHSSSTSNPNIPDPSAKDIFTSTFNSSVGSDSGIITKKLIENINIDVDYRELGGQSFEMETYEYPKVSQNKEEANAHEIDTLYKKTHSKEYSSNDLAEESILGTTLRATHVLARPSTLKHEKEKDNFPNNLNDKSEETYQKRSSAENVVPNALLPSSSEPSNNIIYSVCVAAVTTVVILIIAVTVLALRNAKKKLERTTSGKKDVATVAVYTTSIFHSPLPDPPTFDNPTYISTGKNDDWAEQNEDVIEVQDFNVVFQKPPRISQLESKQYLYDHPPSTGSYRASSDIDTLSQYNTSHKSQIIMEPLYDEIPSRDNPVERTDIYSNVKEKIGDEETNISRNNIDNNSLYVNTFGRTMF